MKDQNVIKEHNISNYTQYNIINAVSADTPESVSKQLKKPENKIRRR